MRSLLLSLLVTASTLSATAQVPVIRARLEPARGIIVGQPVHLVVEILVPNFFTGSPDFPEFELENAIVVLPEESAQNFNDHINGATYAGIRRSYFLYPQQPGDFRLPPAQFAVPYSNSTAKPTVARISLPALTFHADIPAAARNLSYFLPTTQLTLQQRWSAPLKTVRVGDTIQRTIIVTTAKMQAMLIPPLPLEAPDGIRIYAEQPSVQDQKTDRGEFILGRRTESARYFIQKAGDYTLPAIELKWWNLTTNRITAATLPAVHFTAAPNPDYVAELPPEPEPVLIAQPRPVSLLARYKFWIRIAAPSLLAVFFFIWLAWRYLPRSYRYLAARRELLRHSEAAYFRDLIHACGRDDASTSYSWLLRWLARSHPGTTLDQFLARSDDQDLTTQIDLLTAQLYAKPQINTWSGKEMARHLKKHRKLISRSFSQRQHLPTLNP